MKEPTEKLPHQTDVSTLIMFKVSTVILEIGWDKHIPM